MIGQGLQDWMENMSDFNEKMTLKVLCNFLSNDSYMFFFCCIVACMELYIEID